METISRGGRPVAGFSLAGVGVGQSGGGGGVFVPAWLAGAGAGVGVAALTDYFGAPLWGTVLGGVGSAIGVWAGLR